MVGLLCQNAQNQKSPSRVQTVLVDRVPHGFPRFQGPSSFSELSLPSLSWPCASELMESVWSKILQSGLQ